MFKEDTASWRIHTMLVSPCDFMNVAGMPRLPFPVFTLDISKARWKEEKTSAVGIILQMCTLKREQRTLGAAQSATHRPLKKPYRSVQFFTAIFPILLSTHKSKKPVTTTLSMPTGRPSLQNCCKAPSIIRGNTRHEPSRRKANAITG